MYTTYLVNFLYPVYEGKDLNAAKEMAVKAGFESTVSKDGEVILAYSPIGGWKNY